jgi:hypothetical protein
MIPPLKGTHGSKAPLAPSSGAPAVLTPWTPPLNGTHGSKAPLAPSSGAPKVEQPMVVPRVFALRANICSPLGPLLTFTN